MPTDQQAAALAAIDACVVALSAAAADLRASLAEPGPVDPLPPPDPNDLTAPMVQHSELQNLERMVHIEDWHQTGSNYKRDVDYRTWTGATTSIVLRRANKIPGSVPFLPAKTYTVRHYSMRTGALLGSVPVSMDEGQSKSAPVMAPIDTYPDGWVRIVIDGLTDGETQPTFFAYRWIDGSGQYGYMPITTVSVAIDRATRQHAWAIVPVERNAVAAPMRKRQPDPCPLPVKDTQLMVRALGFAPHCSITPIAHAVTSLGVKVSSAVQAYPHEHLVVRYPVRPLIDGPRGVSTVDSIFQLLVGKGQGPDGQPRGNTYIVTPWSFRRMDASGHVTTLLGYYHEGHIGYFSNVVGEKNELNASLPGMKLAGDWSDVPPERWGFARSWGGCWLEDGLFDLDETVTILEEGGQHPHVHAPTWIQVDAWVHPSKPPRLLKAVFDPARHGVPAKVTELVVGTKDDEWFNVIDGPAGSGAIVASNRTLHRLEVRDAKTGALLRVLAQKDPSLPGDALRVDWDVTMMGVKGTVAERRAQPCLAPEGLQRVDDWIYFGSMAAECIKRVHFHTGEVRHVCDVKKHIKSKFCTFAASDGSFGPAGSIGYATFGTSPSALEGLVLPDGSWWGYWQATYWATGGYPTAVAIGGGRVVIQATGGALVEISMAKPGEQPLDRHVAARGRKALIDGPHSLLAGQDGLSIFGVPPPWGENPDLDVLMRHMELPRDTIPGEPSASAT